MELSAVDADKWSPLLNYALKPTISTSETTTVLDYELVQSIRQQQKRLTSEEEHEVVKQYRAGATVYELAAIFGCHRTTISACLKRHHVQMRRAPHNRQTQR